MGDVVPFEAVKPKQMKRSYKKVNYTITFVPASKEWKWDVELVQVTHFGDICPTQLKAIRAAERHIDGVLKLQGKEVG